MPQMKPLNWLVLFLIFSLILMTNISINFFITNHKINSLNNLKIKTSKLLWKW